MIFLKRYFSIMYTHPRMYRTIQMRAATLSASAPRPELPHPTLPPWLPPIPHGSSSPQDAPPRLPPQLPLMAPSQGTSAESRHPSPASKFGLRDLPKPHGPLVPTSHRSCHCRTLESQRSFVHNYLITHVHFGSFRYLDFEVNDLLESSRI